LTYLLNNLNRSLGLPDDESIVEHVPRLQQAGS